MASPSKVAHIWISLLLIYRPQKNERLSWPSWLTYSGRFTQISGHPSAIGRAWNRKSSPVKERRSTTVQRNQLLVLMSNMRTAFPWPFEAHLR